MPWVANIPIGILGGKTLYAARTPGDPWTCEWVDPHTGEACRAGGDTKRNAGPAPYRHDCHGHGATRGEFRRTYYACQHHWMAFLRAHLAEHGAPALIPDPVLVGASRR